MSESESSKAKRPLSFKLPDSLAQKLEEEAERRQITKSELVREAVAEYVIDPEVKAGSFLAAADDLAGCLEADPGLSTSDLEGYGA